MQGAGLVGAGVTLPCRRLDDARDARPVFSFTEAERRWLDGAFTKVCVRAHSGEELLAIVEKAREAGVLVQLCVDAGRTEFHGVPTPTC